jgi:hypothetical protein
MEFYGSIDSVSGSITALVNRLGGGYYNCGYGCQFYTLNPGCTAC